MNEAEVREAVEYFKKACMSIDEHYKINTLISLAESWLARKWPEKKDVTDTPLMTGEMYCDGWNAAIDAMRLASVVSEEEVFNVLREKEIKEGGPNPDRYLREQAHAIAEHINKGGRE